MKLFKKTVKEPVVTILPLGNMESAMAVLELYYNRQHFNYDEEKPIRVDGKGYLLKVVEKGSNIDASLILIFVDVSKPDCQEIILAAYDELILNSTKQRNIVVCATGVEKRSNPGVTTMTFKSGSKLTASLKCEYYEVSHVTKRGINILFELCVRTSLREFIDNRKVDFDTIQKDCRINNFSVFQENEMTNSFRAYLRTEHNIEPLCCIECVQNLEDLGDFDSDEYVIQYRLICDTYVSVAFVG
jgi:hypothetical protein